MSNATTSIEFLCGKANEDGLTVDWIITCDDHQMECRHDWVQWAFPSEEISIFVPKAPTVTPEMMREMPQEALETLIALAGRFVRFLKETDHWRHPGNHNHLRITRLLKCLVMAGENLYAHRICSLAIQIGNPSVQSIHYWTDAITGASMPHEEQK